MPSYVTPKKNAAYKFDIGLVDQSNTKLLRVNPTIAAGDFKVSTDHSAFANLATLPSVNPAGGRSVMIDLSAAEMNGDNIIVQCVDVAGAEWCDLLINVQTTTGQIDDLALSSQAVAIKAKTDNLPSNIQKNTPLNNFEFTMISSTDHVTVKTGLGGTILSYHSIDGAAFVPTTNTPTEVSDGIYKINLSAADLNGDVITFGFRATGADDRFITIITRP